MGDECLATEIEDFINLLVDKGVNVNAINHKEIQCCIEPPK